jgi:hypothetical protein
MVTPERTLSTTVRRVGMEGRLDARARVSSEVSSDDDTRTLTRHG